MFAKGLWMGLVAVVALAANENSWAQVAQSGYWDQTSTWQGGVVPGSNDSVTITSGYTVTARYVEEADNITVQSGAVLAIIDDGSLLMDGGIDSNHDINGVIEIGNATSAGSLVFWGVSLHTISGSGSITGLNNSSALQIVNGKTLRNKVLAVSRF